MNGSGYCMPNICSLPMLMSGYWILDTPLPSYIIMSLISILIMVMVTAATACSCVCVSCKYSDCGAQLCCQLYQSACWRICTRSLMPVSRSRPLVRNHRKLLSLAASEVARRSHIKHFRRRISRLQPSPGSPVLQCTQPHTAYSRFPGEI